MCAGNLIHSYQSISGFHVGLPLGPWLSVWLLHFSDTGTDTWGIAGFSTLYRKPQKQRRCHLTIVLNLRDDSPPKSSGLFRDAVYYCTVQFQQDKLMTACGTSCHVKPVRGVFTTRHTNKTIKLDSPHLSLNSFAFYLLNLWLYKTSTEGKLVGTAVKRQTWRFNWYWTAYGIHYSEGWKQDSKKLLGCSFISPVNPTNKYKAQIHLKHMEKTHKSASLSHTHAHIHMRHILCYWVIFFPSV